MKILSNEEQNKIYRKMSVAQKLKIVNDFYNQEDEILFEYKLACKDTVRLAAE